MDDHIRTLERDVRAWKRYVIGLGMILAAVGVAAFQQSDRRHFTELEVERINIIEANGMTRLAISNASQLPPITIHGKEYPGLRGGSAVGGAGMIYFNDEGTENGGLVWGGRRFPDGNYGASGLLTFDQYMQDEAITLTYIDRSGQRRAGLTIIDEPETSIQASLDSLMLIRGIPDSAERARRTHEFREEQLRRGQVRATRLFAGKSSAKAAVLSLSDPQGRPRLRLSVDSVGVARLELLDESGRIVESYSGR